MKMDTYSDSVGEFLLSHLSWVITAVIILLLYFSLKPDRRIERYLKTFDGPISLPIIGSAYFFLIYRYYELPDLLVTICQRYNSAIKFWIGRTVYVSVNRPADVEKILSSTIHIEKSTDYNFLHKWLGLGLLTAKPELWHSRRKLLTPTFHFKILEEFMEIFNEEGNTFVNVLGNDHSDGKTFNIYNNITRCALDVICETAMGIKIHAQSNQTLAYVKAVYGYGSLIMKKALFPWLQIDFVCQILGYKKIEVEYLKVLHNFTESVIRARKAEREQEKLSPLQDHKTKDHVIIDELITKRRKAFLDLLLDLAEKESEHPLLTESEIRQEVDTFMFEGHDTTAANMGWTVFLLALYPEHQRKVQEELDEIFGTDRTRNITPADITRMKYLELCIKESLRLYPSVPFNLRYLNQDADLGNNRIIPRGANVFVSAYVIHRDPELYPDPETFNPQRFLPENCVGRHPYAYIPFSAGPRNCIGQKFALLEDKIILAKLLMNFKIKTAMKRNEMIICPDLILRPIDGIHVQITPR